MFDESFRLIEKQINQELRHEKKTEELQFFSYTLDKVGPRPDMNSRKDSKMEILLFFDELTQFWGRKLAFWNVGLMTTFNLGLVNWYPTTTYH